MQPDVRKLAKLAKIRLDDAEAGMFKEKMRGVLTMLDTLPQLEGELPPNPDSVMATRADEPHTSLPRDKLLENAAVKQAGCFVVPKAVKAE
jgi:aspartyl-tRNA(Asn)/glutamyl-tRNA(Gln) amidotransferase subunit C